MVKKVEQEVRMASTCNCDDDDCDGDMARLLLLTIDTLSRNGMMPVSAKRTGMWSTNSHQCKQASAIPNGMILMRG